MKSIEKPLLLLYLHWRQVSKHLWYQILKIPLLFRKEKLLATSTLLWNHRRSPIIPILGWQSCKPRRYILLAKLYPLMYIQWMARLNNSTHNQRDWCNASSEKNGWVNLPLFTDVSYTSILLLFKSIWRDKWNIIVLIVKVATFSYIFPL